METAACRSSRWTRRRDRTLFFIFDIIFPWYTGDFEEGCPLIPNFQFYLPFWRRVEFVFNFCQDEPWEYFKTILIGICKRLHFFGQRLRIDVRIQVVHLGSAYLFTFVLRKPPRFPSLVFVHLSYSYHPRCELMSRTRAYGVWRMARRQELFVSLFTMLKVTIAN
jgi:hypothetical protein